MKFLAVIFALVLGIGFGRLLPLEPAPPASRNAQDGPALAKRAEELRAPGRAPAATTRALPPAPMIAARGLSAEEKRARIRKVFPAGRMGDELAQATMLFPYATTGLPQDKQLSKILNDLRKNPRQALFSIQDGLQKFPPELEPERMTWVQIASRLETPAADRVEFLRSELARGFEPPPADAAHLANPAENAATTVDCLLDVTQDPKEVELAVQPTLQRFAANQTASSLLLARVATRLPELGKELAKRYR